MPCKRKSHVPGLVPIKEQKVAQQKYHPSAWDAEAGGALELPFPSSLAKLSLSETVRDPASKDKVECLRRTGP